MIEKIYIPTLKRIDRQITYDQLPDDLKKRVVMVVQSWEREQYNYDCEYFVLPDYVTPEHPTPIATTRKLIYENAGKIKYAVIDDDLFFYRRNSKYWSDVPDMEKSKRRCTEEDMRLMFQTFSEWLDNEKVSFCGPVSDGIRPSNTLYDEIRSLSGAFFFNGNDFYDDLPDMRLDEVRVCEDVLMNLELFTRGYGNRLSNQFIFSNGSFNSSKNNIPSEIWDNQSVEMSSNDFEKLQSMFPGIFTLVYDKDNSGKQKSGGYRGIGKCRVRWKKAYENSIANTLKEFL